MQAYDIITTPATSGSGLKPLLGKMNRRISIIFVGLLCLISTASAKCSFFQRVTQCNVASKIGFATAFATAAKLPATGCSGMSNSEWSKVGCSSPSSHQSTKVCAPAKWSKLLKLFATAMALKKKMLFRSPYTRSKLFNTSSGRALVRHELAHIRQQAGRSAYSYGYSYISAYCKAGCSYSKNKFEVDARKYQNDIC